MRRKRNQRSSFYYNSKSNSRDQKKNTTEIKSVSTNISRDNDNKKKIINLSKPLVKKDNPKKIQLDKKRPQNFKKNKIELKFKSKVPRTIIPYKLNVLENSICQICNKTINNMANAIFEKGSDKKYHFECITGELRKIHFMKPNQRIAYVGNNSFAIIEDVKEDGKMKFKISQKVQYTPKAII